jgi:type VI secretion system secreted protein VgrG
MASATGGGGGGGGNGDMAVLENRKLKMVGPLPEKEMYIKAARVVEGLSRISEITVDCLSKNKSIDLKKLVGQKITVKMLRGEDNATPAPGGASGASSSEQWREHVGTCIEARYIGEFESYGFYSLQVRPWLWFLTQTSNCRIFQDLDVIEIVKKIFSDRGFSDYEFKCTTPKKRIYTTQYNETDFDFISRLLEEEGFYYYSVVKGGKDHLVVVDDKGKHTAVEGNATIQFNKRETGRTAETGGGSGYRKKDDHIFDFRPAEAVTQGKVTLTDYDFEKPKSDLKVAKEMAKGEHSHKNYEGYAYPGQYRETGLGDTFVKVKIEAKAWPYQVSHGVANVREMATGSTFTMSGYDRSGDNKEYLVIGAEHLMQIENQSEDETQKIKGVPGSIVFDEENKDAYRCNFSVIPKATQFRAPLTTPAPKMHGILVAKVTGPAGEEIYTDKYGRIKVQFPWDREGKNDDKSSRWVRVVTPWSGVNWGMVHVPRIGQEVVIQFQDGNLDEPICIGMLYNADTMPPYTLADNKTQMGIKTRSSKGGGAENYNELVFEDLKDKEFIRMHSEKDYFLTVENDATVSIGQSKKNPGSITTDIYKDRTETIHTGDLTLTVKSGNEKRDIKTNRDEKIGGNATQEVTGNKTMTVKGNFEGSTSGNSTSKVTGNASTDVTGSKGTKVTGGYTMESMQSIELKVGANSIKIDQTGVTINGLMIKTKASTMAEHDGGPMMIIKGGFVMIN